MARRNAVKRFWFAVAVFAFLIASPPVPIAAQELQASVDGTVTLDDGSQLWFVELSNPPTSEDGDLAAILAEQAAFRVSAASARLQFVERRSYQSLFNGFSVAIQPRDAAKLARVPGVVAIYPVSEESFDPGEPISEIELLTALAMTGADIAQNSLGLTGDGIKVGVIDSGIDYDHPAFGGDGVTRIDSPEFPNARVVIGWDFVGDAFNTTGIPVPDPRPDDCGGHGTHVAGIIGADGTVTGVAPGVTFGSYRVVGCGTTTTTDLLIAAMEMALADGMDVVNMSIGSAFQWPSNPSAKAADRLVNKGVVFVASIGNTGASGLYVASSPGVGKKAIGVASFNNTHITQSAFTITPDNMAIGYNIGSGNPPPPTSGTFPMARTGTQTSAADACAPLPAGSLAGKVALIRRGTCSFYQKCFNAQSAGAIAVVLYNNASGAFIPNVVGTPPITIPVVSITQAAGNLIDTRLASGPVDLTWGGTVTAPNLTGGQISSFSSFGLSPDLAVKPDIGAPGGFIYSTVPLEQGAYGQNSGTSMASPHVAGSAALVLEAKPNTSANGMRDILMSTAEPAPARANALLGPEVVNLQGAGMVHVDQAATSTTTIVPGKLSLGESEGGPVAQTLTIENGAEAPVTYTLSNVSAAATGPNTFTPSFLASSNSVGFSVNPLVVPANGTATVDVTIAPDAGLPDRAQYGGYILFTPDDSGQEYRVTYAGFKGDFQSIPALTPGGNGFPWLAKQIGTSLVNQPAGASFTLQGTDVPNFVYHLDHPVSLLRFEAFEAVSGDTWHRVAETKEFRRSTGPASFFAQPWDGVTTHGPHETPVPNGDYVVKITVVRALGDPENPAHVETWTSPVITIARPEIAMIDGLTLTPASFRAGDDVTVSATVRNDGASTAEDLVVRFQDNGTEFGSATVDLAPGAEAEVQAVWHVGAPEQHTLRVVADPEGVFTESNYDDNVADLVIGSIVGVEKPLPTRLFLAAPSPNPFGRDVTFRFGLPEAGPVTFEAFDMLGRRLRMWQWSELEAGVHTLNWDGRVDNGRQAAAGVMLYRITALGRTLTEKAVRLP
jgi:minor extracellular serine protease Vpr